MWETCAIDLKVQLPRTVAVELEEVQVNPVHLNVISDETDDPNGFTNVFPYPLIRLTAARGQ